MWNIVNGNNVAVLRQYPDNHFDSIVTDPPYGIDFLGKAWDANTGALETYQECLRVLKPGGHILAFSAPRTYHHLAVTIEQAGFEIRDQIMWIYSSGFPKSQDIGRQIHKKAHGKPDKQRFDPGQMIKINGDKYRHPATNKIYRALPDINGDRLAQSHEGQGYGTVFEEIIEVDNAWTGWGTQLKPAHEPIVMARKPLGEANIRENCLQWSVGAINIDATRIPVAEDELEWFQGNWDRINAGMGEYVKLDGSVAPGADQLRDQMQDISGYKPDGRFPSNVIGEIADYQKYFYCPKVSKAERGSGNNHPTVKPIDLMRYLIRLVTPAGGHVLDPFNGSGSTGCAAVELGMDYTGIELDENYVAIAQRRIEAWADQCKSGTTFEALFE